MISTTPTCQKCSRRNIISFRVEPEEALAAVTLNRWRTNICPSCFDQETEKASIRYTLTQLDGVSWSDKPPPRNPYKAKGPATLQWPAPFAACGASNFLAITH
jgi:hypothetical protein